jgi:hypothetical protein
MRQVGTSYRGVASGTIAAWPVFRLVALLHEVNKSPSYFEYRAVVCLLVTFCFLLRHSVQEVKVLGRERILADTCILMSCIS